LKRIRENGPAGLRAVLLVRQEIATNAGRKRSGGGSNPFELNLDSKRWSATLDAIARRLIYNLPITHREHATRRTVTIIPSPVLNPFGLLTWPFLLARVGGAAFCRGQCRSIPAFRRRQWSNACALRKVAFRLSAEPPQCAGKPSQGAMEGYEGLRGATRGYEGATRGL